MIPEIVYVYIYHFSLRNSEYFTEYEKRISDGTSVRLQSQMLRVPTLSSIFLLNSAKIYHLLSELQSESKQQVKSLNTAQRRRRIKVSEYKT